MLKKIEIPILMYHRIIEEKIEEGIYGTYVYKNELVKQFDYLKEKKIQPITFQDIEAGVLNNKNQKFVILSFDDGYLDNYTILFPLLKKYNYKAVIYPVTNEEYNAWDSENKIPLEKKIPLMNWNQMREMKKTGLVEFGGHTKKHCDLLQIDNEKALKEIKECKEILEQELESQIISFAYPYGFFNIEHKEILKNEGYKYGVATASGPVNFFEDFYHIRRIGIFSKDDIKKYSKKVSGKYNSKKVRSEKIKKLRKKIKDIIGWSK